MTGRLSWSPGDLGSGRQFESGQHSPGPVLSTTVKLEELAKMIHKRDAASPDNLASQLEDDLGSLIDMRIFTFIGWAVNCYRRADLDFEVEGARYQGKGQTTLKLPKKGGKNAPTRDFLLENTHGSTVPGLLARARGQEGAPQFCYMMGSSFYYAANNTMPALAVVNQAEDEFIDKKGGALRDTAQAILNRLAHDTIYSIDEAVGDYLDAMEACLDRALGMPHTPADFLSRLNYKRHGAAACERRMAYWESVRDLVEPIHEGDISDVVWGGLPVDQRGGIIKLLRRRPDFVWLLDHSQSSVEQGESANLWAQFHTQADPNTDWPHLLESVRTTQWARTRDVLWPAVTRAFELYKGQVEIARAEHGSDALISKMIGLPTTGVAKSWRLAKVFEKRYTLCRQHGEFESKVRKVVYDRVLGIHTEMPDGAEARLIAESEVKVALLDGLEADDRWIIERIFSFTRGQLAAHIPEGRDQVVLPRSDVYSMKSLLAERRGDERKYRTEVLEPIRRIFGNPSQAATGEAIAQLGATLPSSQPTMSRLETGDKTIDVAMACARAAAGGYDSSWLIWQVSPADRALVVDQFSQWVRESMCSFGAAVMVTMAQLWGTNRSKMYISLSPGLPSSRGTQLALGTEMLAEKVDAISFSPASDGAIYYDIGAVPVMGDLLHATWSQIYTKEFRADLKGVFAKAAAGEETIDNLVRGAISLVRGAASQLTTDRVDIRLALSSMRFSFVRTADLSDLPDRASIDPAIKRATEYVLEVETYLAADITEEKRAFAIAQYPRRMAVLFHHEQKPSEELIQEMLGMSRVDWIAMLKSRETRFDDGMKHRVATLYGVSPLWFVLTA